MILRRWAAAPAVPLLAATAVLAFGARTVHATGDTFTVDTTADFVNAADTPGVCAGSGANATHCSLRAAIQQADRDGGGTITFAGGVDPRLSLAADNSTTIPDDITTGDLDITAPITITGGGSSGTGATTISGGAVDRVFHVTSSGVTIQHVHVTDGAAGAPANAATTDGGGILEDGTGASLTLADVLIDQSTAGSDGLSGNGGGLADEGGSLSVDGLTLGGGTNGANGNTANNAGNTGGDGGGAYITFDNSNGQAVSLTNVSALGNTANAFCDLGGGGIAVTGQLAGAFSLTDAILQDNSTSDGECSQAKGGGIAVDVQGGGGTAGISGVTVTGNSADEGGGAWAQVESGTGSAISISQTSLTGNHAGDDGGGIAIGRDATLDQAFVAGNTAGTSGGGVYFTSTGRAAGGGTVENATITHNDAGANGTGDGVALGFTQVGLLRESTVAENDADGSGAGAQVGVEGSGEQLTLEDDIIGGRTGGVKDCDTGRSALPASGGGNVVDDSTCGLVATGDLQSTDPLLTAVFNPAILGSRAALPAWQQHYAIAATSPARDHVPTASCPVTHDQLGTARPQGPACDSGAFELPFIATPTATPLSTPTASPGGAIIPPSTGGGDIAGGPGAAALLVVTGLVGLAFVVPGAVRRRR